MTTQTTVTLKPKQERAIVALLEHPTIEAAARALGITSMTLSRWLKQEDFLNAYQAARREHFSHAATKLTTGSSRATAALIAIMEDPATPAYARAAAAKSVLDLAYKLVELEEMNVRMARMEKIFGH